MNTLRWSVALALTATVSFGFGCKKSKAEIEAEEAQKLVESHEALRERLRKSKAVRAEREKYLRAHPELLEPPAEPDPEHRPTAPVPSNLPPQLLGAPPVDPAIALSAFAPPSSASSAPPPAKHPR
jgi:hypothetical protein